jgi:hypothetical protein
MLHLRLRVFRRMGGYQQDKSRRPPPTPSPRERESYRLSRVPREIPRPGGGRVIGVDVMWDVRVEVRLLYELGLVGATFSLRLWPARLANAANSEAAGRL